MKYGDACILGGLVAATFVTSKGDRTVVKLPSGFIIVVPSSTVAAGPPAADALEQAELAEAAKLLPD